MINGIITAIITPFLNQKIDFNSFETILKSQIKGNISGIVLFGSTGEGSNIELSEYSTTIKFVSDFLIKNSSSIKLFVGCSATSTQKVVNLCNIAKDKGAFGVLIAPAPYIKPTQDGIFDIYKQASKIGLPIIAYNIPGRVCVEISDDTIVKISELQNVIALKDSSGDIRKIIGLKNRIQNKDFMFFAGDDYMLISAMAHGANGLISVASNIIPKQMIQIYEFCKNNNYDNANEVFNRIYPIFNSLYCQSNPIPIKFAAKYINLIQSNEMREPLLALTDEKLIQVLTKDIDLAVLNG